MRKSLLFISLSVAFSQQSFGQRVKEPKADVKLDSVVVKETRLHTQIDAQNITEQYIQSQPKNNGTINELLKNNPNVRFSNNNNVSETLGEINPEKVSIHGQPFYSNLWVLDGISNSNNINPGSIKGRINSIPGGNNPTNLPDGDPQNFWVDSDLIGSMDVYDSNISAKYGQFTGGVIDAKIKDPDPIRASGSIFYRTTRDAWTQFHIDKDNWDDSYSFESAERLEYQPKFIKHSYGFNVNTPLNNQSALLFSYNINKSKIPNYNSALEQWYNQRRSSETFLLKGLYEAGSDDTFKVSLMYSPHDSKFFKQNNKNGEYTNTGGGYYFNTTWDHRMSLGMLKSQIAYTQAQNEIDHGSNQWFVWRPSENINWLSGDNVSREGGFGKFDTDKKTFTLKQDFDFNTFKAGQTEHSISLGWNADLAQAAYHRENDVFAYGAPFKPEDGSSVICMEGDKNCIAGDQFQKMKMIYPAVNSKVTDNHYAFYVQDAMKWNRLKVTAGARLDHDHFLKNTNIAPRLSLSYDLFGNESSILFGGVNRYYSDSVLSLALSHGVKRIDRYERTESNQPFVYQGTQSSGFGSGGLKTPYSDEINLGLKQNFGNTEWVFKWVNRQGRDQFAYNREKEAKKPEYIFYQKLVLNNHGRNESNSFSLSGKINRPLQLNLANVRADWGASYIKSKTNFNSYQDQLDDVIDREKVIIDGKLMDRHDMPALNFNNPWNLFANVNFDFKKYHFNWNNHINFSSGYIGYKTKRIECPEGNANCGDYVGKATLYQKKQFKPYVSLDWNFNYSIPVAKADLNISLDVFNVFNSKIASASSNAFSSNSYQAGRQFWLGARYQW